MKSLKAIFRRQKDAHHQDDISRTSSVSNLNADAKAKNQGQGAFAKVRKSQSKDKLNENGQKLDKKGCNKNNNQIDVRAEDLGLQEQLEAMAGEKAELVLQLGENRNQLGILQSEISHLKMFQEQSAAQVEQLTDENAALRNKLRDVVHSPLSDNEKQMLLLDSQRHHSSAPASIAANALGDGDLTACSTPDWDKQSSSNVSEVSVACLQDKINQMQETHYSTNEELQATLQELTDLQRQLTEVQQDNERLMEEKNLMFQSLCRQTERLNGARNEIDSLKHLLCKEADDTGQYESVVEREQKLVDLLKGAQEEREKLLMKHEQMNNEILEKNAIMHQKETENVQLSERVRTLESMLDAKHAEHKQMDVEVARAKDSASSRQIEIDRLRDLLENARTKIVELEQDRALSDKSELDDLLDNARKEKDALESEVANLKEQVARGRNESEKLREQVSILQEECKVLRNNGKCLQSELEYKVEKLSAEKANVTEQLQHLEEAANELQVQAQCQLEDKRQLSSVLSETQRNMSEVERKNLEYEVELRDLKRLRDEENEEWQKFQNDLLTSVRVANDFKTEAQQELQKLVMENKAHRDKIRLLESQLEKLKGDVEEFMKKRRGDVAEVLDVEAEYSKIDKNVPYDLLKPQEKFIVKLHQSLEQEKDYKKAIRFSNRNPVAISKPLLDSVYKNPSLKSIAESNEYLNLENFAQEKPLKPSRLTRSMNDLNATDIEFLHQTLAQRDSDMSTYQDSILFGNSIEVPRGYVYDGELSVADLNIEELIAKVEAETPEEEKLLQQMRKEMAKIGRKNTLKKKVLDKRKVYVSSPSLESVLKNEKLAQIIHDPTIMDVEKPFKSKLKRLTRYQDISFKTSTADNFEAIEENLRTIEAPPTREVLELPSTTTPNEEEEEDGKSNVSLDSKVYSYCFATGAVNVEAPTIQNSKIQLFVNTEPAPKIFKEEERKSFISFGKDTVDAIGSNRISETSEDLAGGSNSKVTFSTFGKSREDLSDLDRTETSWKSSNHLDKTKAIDPLYAITNSLTLNGESKVKNEDGASAEYSKNEEDLARKEIAGGALISSNTPSIIIDTEEDTVTTNAASIPGEAAEEVFRPQTLQVPLGSNYRNLKKETYDLSFKFSEAIGDASAEDTVYSYNEDTLDSRATSEFEVASDFDSVEAFKDQSDFGQNSSDDETEHKNSTRNPLFWSMETPEEQDEDNSKPLKPKTEEISIQTEDKSIEVKTGVFSEENSKTEEFEAGLGLLKLEDFGDNSSFKSNRRGRYLEDFLREEIFRNDIREKSLKSEGEAKLVRSEAIEIVEDKPPEEGNDTTSTIIRRGKEEKKDVFGERRSFLGGDEQSLEELLEGSNILRAKSKKPKFVNFGARRSKHIEKTKALFEINQNVIVETSKAAISGAKTKDITEEFVQKSSEVEDNAEDFASPIRNNKEIEETVKCEGQVQTETVEKLEDLQTGQPHQNVRTIPKQSFDEFEDNSLSGFVAPEELTPTPEKLDFEQENELYERRSGIRPEDNFSEAANKAITIFNEDNRAESKANVGFEYNDDDVDGDQSFISGDLTEEELKLVRFAKSVSFDEDGEELTEEDKDLIEYARRKSVLLEIPEEIRERVIEEKHLQIFHDMIQSSDDVTVEEFEEFRGHYKDVVSSLKNKFNKNDEHDRGVDCEDQSVQVRVEEDEDDVFLKEEGDEDVLVSENLQQNDEDNKYIKEYVDEDKYMEEYVDEDKYMKEYVDEDKYMKEYADEDRSARERFQGDEEDKFLKETVVVDCEDNLGFHGDINEIRGEFVKETKENGANVEVFKDVKEEVVETLVDSVKFRESLEDILKVCGRFEDNLRVAGGEVEVPIEDLGLWQNVEEDEKFDEVEDNLRVAGVEDLGLCQNVEDGKKFDEVEAVYANLRMLRSSNESILRRFASGISKTPVPLPRISQNETSLKSKSVKNNFEKMENLSGALEIPSESKKSSGAIPKVRSSIPETAELEENSDDFPSATSKESNHQSMENLYESPTSSEGNFPQSTQPQPSESYLEMFKKPEDKVFENLSPVKEKREYFTFTIKPTPEKPTVEARQSSDKVAALKKRFEDNKDVLECGPTFHNLKSTAPPQVKIDPKHVDSVSEIKLHEQNLDDDDDENSKNGAEMRARKDNLDIGNSRESFEMAKKIFENKGK